MSDASGVNVVDLFLHHTGVAAHRPALDIPVKWDADGTVVYQSATYGELASMVARLQSGMAAQGLKRGNRVVLMFPFSVELYATVIALFASGMAAVFIDAGMGPLKVLGTIAGSGASAIISVRTLLKRRFLFPQLWRLKRYAIDTQGLFLRPFSSLLGEAGDGLKAVRCDPDEHALITFTSGSTGRPKGVDRTHGLLIAQHHAQREEFPDTPDDVDMPCWPVLALHNLCCGIRTVLPPIDLRRPGSADGQRVTVQIRSKGVTRLSGGPAYMEQVVSYMERADLRLPAVAKLFVGGGPVPRPLVARIRDRFPDTACTVLYGSSEAEPMTRVDMEEILASEGTGYLVGRPGTSTTLGVANIPVPAPAMDARGLDPYRAKPGEPGEVLVAGPHVSRHYLDDPEADRENKLVLPDGTVWHRTGDVGYVDERGRLWLVGRCRDAISHKGRIVHPLPVEAAMDAVAGVDRSAVVACDAFPEGVAFVHVSAGADSVAVGRTVRDRLRAHDLEDLPVRFVSGIPVDRRHNTKIDRPALRQMRGAACRDGGGA